MTPAAISIDAITLKTTGICSVVRAGIVGADFLFLSLNSLYMLSPSFFSPAAVTDSFADGASFSTALLCAGVAEDSAFL